MAKLGEVGKLSLTITDPEGKAISTARVDLKRDGQSIPAYPDAKGEIEIFLPPGEWKLTTKDNGREASIPKSLLVRKKRQMKKLLWESSPAYILPSLRKTEIPHHVRPKSSEWKVLRPPG